MGLEPYKITCFTSEETDIDDSDAELEQPTRNKSKEQIEELAETNLPAQGEEP